MTLPMGAQAILTARKRGMKPADMIIVSLVGQVQDKMIQECNPTVYANPKASSPYDWRWAVDLKLCVYKNLLIDWRPTAMAIARSRPAWLGVWDVDALEGADLCALPKVEDIEKRAELWRWDLHVLRWLQFQNYQFAGVQL